MTPRISSRLGRRLLVTGGAAVALALTACTPPGQPSQQPPGPGTPPPPQPETPGAHAQSGSFSGTLAEPGGQGNAFTYDPAAAPVGAHVETQVHGSPEATTVNFKVDGFQPNRGYAVHAHVNPCGPTGDAAGPHFQNRQDPAASPQKPSTDPAFANPQNEIWLDLGTDAQGSGEATTQVPFGFTERAPKSIIVHEAQQTSTGPGEAGKAGGRSACLNIES
ncbi:MAG: superoxide dismutase family protein [Saccharopolyspora sp.]|uniref:superoxide dismutase family protein n=1 Tax=Saccharopolyspora TaxID=1835 RepID=UPI001909F9E2|nr:MULTISPECIES: superoxide dismutase family protein [unclassified Saccharopolyspora]MBK0865511.1 superoxide dismutase family protein [Saccharopolyspora sp. HNM0986]MBQ6641784.1 superoxide dismutase family protein [Saccharopolyspora sp.]